MQTIGIIGGTNGLGKRFAEFFTEKFPEKKILTSGRNTKITNQQLVQKSDLVIFAVPIGITQELILSLKDFAKPQQIWTDFTSIKGFVLDTFSQIPNLNYCGLHPIFGPLKDIRNQKLVFCPGNLSPKNQTEIRKLLEDFEIIETSPENHDRMMGVVQCVSHFSDFVLGKVLKDLKIPFSEILQYASSPYRVKLDLLARIFAQNPVLYTEISQFNPYGEKFQQAFVDAGNDWIKILKTGDKTKLQETFLNIEHFIGDNFCTNAWEKSQSLLAEEARLHTHQHAKNITPPSSLHKDQETPITQKKQKLQDTTVIFGEKYSHTDEASQLFTPQNQQKAYRKNIFEVFDAVEEGENITGIIPYENSTQGSVFDTLDELFDRNNIRIIQAQEMSIGQHLLIVPNTKPEEIKTIFSHPQALAQSQKFLRKFCPEARLESMPSTAIAVQRVSEWGNKTKAAIGSKYAAQAWNLKILAENMEQENNRTRFVQIIKSDLDNLNFLQAPSFTPTPKDLKEKLPPNTDTHVSFVVWFHQDKAGNLAEFLMYLSQQKINLSKLDSRRANEKMGNYLFFFDAEVAPKKFAEIYPELQKLVGGIKILGKF